jgi:hypothetical protein
LPGSYATISLSTKTLAIRTSSEGSRVTKPQKTAKRKRWGSTKGRCYTAIGKQMQVVGLTLTGKRRREIARELGLDRETVTRILSQEENQQLVQGYREAVLKIVPDALVQLSNLVDHGDRTAVIETLYGAKVLIDRHEVAPEPEEPVRTYDSTRVLFFGKYHRWPKDSELLAFDRTIPTEPLVKGSLKE